MMEELKGTQFDEVVSQDQVTFVKFGAPWCSPCVNMDKVLDRLVIPSNPEVKFSKVNVDDEYELAARFQIRSIPHFVIFRNGEKVKELHGVIRGEEINEVLAEVVVAQ